MFYPHTNALVCGVKRLPSLNTVIDINLIQPKFLTNLPLRLPDFHPGLFARWWEDAVTYARREAARGSPVAREDLAALDANPDARPSPEHKVFHDYSFPFVGRRDEHGQFRQREEFYRLSPQFAAAYQQEVSAWLCQLAEDVFS